MSFVPRHIISIEECKLDWKKGESTTAILRLSIEGKKLTEVAEGRTTYEALFRAAAKAINTELGITFQLPPWPQDEAMPDMLFRVCDYFNTNSPQSPAP